MRQEWDGNRIKRLRTALGLSQEKLAERLGVTFATVNRWENGVARPSRLSRLRLAELAGSAVTEDESANSGRVMREAAPKPAAGSDFAAPPDSVRLVVEGHRLSHGYLFNPAFATETSLVDPLPHQRIAVYDHMLCQPRLRFLLADDAGAGKTIMAGLYVREMLARRLIRRVLVVPPAGLVGNWRREMRSLFNLPFEILSGSDARSRNPFVGPGSDLVIISVDTLSSGRTFERLCESEVEPYDLVVFDEAHKLAVDRNPDLTVRRTNRYRLAEVLAGVQPDDQHRSRPRTGWNPQHLLLLTATPHMGRDYPYFGLWRLLEPNVLTTVDAFSEFPPYARAAHFLRRTKEEMVYYDGRPIYPTRESHTAKYNLTPAEQQLYDETTSYIRTFYNKARVLNRSAARLVMTVFQRRLASSTYALLRSFERRIEKLDDLIEAIRSGRISAETLHMMQQRLQHLTDAFDETTADEESSEDGREQHEIAEEKLLGGVVATSLAELQAERSQVEALLTLARQVEERGEESKFDRLCELIRDPDYQNEKVIIFSEHRDTLNYIVRRLQGIGYTDQIAMIHGGMPYTERENQVEAFRGRCRFLVATDAAGEGINLQFCWLMVNYDVPWNPARLEQRLGRIHRYRQRHDPVIILNLAAAKTREGRVLTTLLEKLEKIRKELHSDKVFDVIGMQFEGVSLKDIILRATVDDDEAGAIAQIEGMLTPEQVKARSEAREKLLSTGGDVAIHLEREQRRLADEEFLRLLPGYVAHFIERSAPALGARIEGDLYESFRFTALPDALLPALDSYPENIRTSLTVSRPEDGNKGVFLHPGEPFFEAYRDYFCARFAADAKRGAAFIDPYSDAPYLFHLARVSVIRRADSDLLEAYGRDEVLETRLVGMKQTPGGQIELCPVEQLMALQPGNGVPLEAQPLVRGASTAERLAATWLMDKCLPELAEQKRAPLLASLPEREDFVRRGFAYQDAELAAARTRLAEKARAGDHRAAQELARVKERQQGLLQRRERAIRVLRRETELIAPGEIEFLAHALVLPSRAVADRERYDKEIEAIAVRVATAYEESHRAWVEDVSDPTRAMGFDLLSHRPGNEDRAIEVKGRRAVGDIQMSANEWVRAANLRAKYWLYVAYDCATAHPRLLRVQDPIGKLAATERGGVIIDEKAIFDAAEA
jgi:superfamily II DNA or RNA helicase/DNA-binding XRE family transcriptional regulator